MWMLESVVPLSPILFFLLLIGRPWFVADYVHEIHVPELRVSHTERTERR
jgi:hypothetical protein